MATILDLLDDLDDAEYNLKNVARNPDLLQELLPIVLGKMKNGARKNAYSVAVCLLAKGYSPDDDANYLLCKYGDLAHVPVISESE